MFSICKLLEEFLITLLPSAKLNNENWRGTGEKKVETKPRHLSHSNKYAEETVTYICLFSPSLKKNHHQIFISV